MFWFRWHPPGIIYITATGSVNLAPTHVLKRWCTICGAINTKITRLPKRLMSPESLRVFHFMVSKIAGNSSMAMLAMGMRLSRFTIMSYCNFWQS